MRETKDKTSGAPDTKQRIARAIMKLNIVFALLEAFYLANVFFDIPALSTARDIWIETAMTTADHQWLATRLFPSALIERVMSRQVVTDEGTISDPSLIRLGWAAGERDGGNLDVGSGAGGSGTVGSGAGGSVTSGSGAVGSVTSGNGAVGNGGDGFAVGEDGGGGVDGIGWDAGVEGVGALAGAGIGLENSAAPTPTGVAPTGAGPLDGAGAIGAPTPSGAPLPKRAIGSMGGPNSDAALPWPKVGEKDEHGNTVIVRDEAEDIVVIEVRAANYVGRLLFVQDPSRVVVKHTRSKEVRGELIKDYLSKHGAIAGINGNGFYDPDGHGQGGTIIGWSVSGGVPWGSGSKGEYASVGLNEDDVLIVGIIKDFSQHHIRDLAQYGPSLIVDGKKLVSGSAGWGLQPRTAVGQREDGAIILATFDGRQPGHSVGITAGEVADVLLKYGCVNAGLCDGGSSSVMMYDGKILGKPSTPMKDTGRYLPNAFLVLKKATGMRDDSLYRSNIFRPTTYNRES